MKYIVSFFYALLCLVSLSVFAQNIVFENRSSNPNDKWAYRTLSFTVPDTSSITLANKTFSVYLNILDKSSDIEFFQIRFQGRMFPPEPYNYFTLELIPKDYYYADENEVLRRAGFEKESHWFDDSDDNMVIRFAISRGLDTIKCYTSQDKMEKIYARANNSVTLDRLDQIYDYKKKDWFRSYYDLFVRVDAINWEKYPKKLAKHLKKNKYR